jgi:uncharacterized protein (DUF1697 family)
LKTYIALFRGINVGGHNKLPMRELVLVLEELGLQNARTYIQSGNVVFSYEEEKVEALETKIAAAVARSHGFSPQVLILDAVDLEGAVAVNPYPEAENEPKTLHLFFLKAEPTDADMQKLLAKKTHGEDITLKEKVLYLFAPDGIGRSKVAAAVEKTLGVAATGRNWRTVTALSAMAKG